MLVNGFKEKIIILDAGYQGLDAGLKSRGDLKSPRDYQMSDEPLIELLDDFHILLAILINPLF
jgi:hypothetical protein